MYEEILDHKQELLKDEIKNFSGDFGKLEQAVMEMMMSFGKGLLQRGPAEQRTGELFCQQANHSYRWLYLAVDGTTTHETDGWHEVKVGSIYWKNERFERIGHYVGRFDNSETFGWYVWMEVCRCGLRGLAG